MSFRCLFILLFINSFVYAQEFSSINPNDTIVYDILGTKNKQVFNVNSEEANLAIDVYKNGQKIKTVNESNSINFPEIISLDASKKANYILKIYALSFLKSVKNYSVKITPIKDEKISLQIDKSKFLEDLKFFKSIREQVNSGLYVYRTKKEIDSIYNWAFAEINASKDVLDFYKIIVTLTDFEGSCHNGTQLPTALDNYLNTLNYLPPIAFKNLGNKVVSNSENHKIPLGAELLSINGIEIPEITQRLSKYYHTDGFSKPFKEIFAYEKGFFEKYILEFGIPKNYKITYKVDHKIQSIVLDNVSKEEYTKIFEKRFSSQYDDHQQSKKYSFTKIDEDLYQLSVRGFDFASSIDAEEYKAYEQFFEHSFQFLKDKNIQNLIIDLRYNKGGAGFLYEKLYTYLTDRPFRDSFYAYRNFEKIPYQDHFVITPYLKENLILNTDDFNKDILNYSLIQSLNRFYISDEKNPLIFPNDLSYNGQLYLIIDENTASAAAHLASLIKSYTNAIVIGKETMGGYYEHNGHIPAEYQLPHSKILTRFSIMHVIQDAKILPDQSKGSGVKPHYEINPSIEEFLNKEDVELKFIKNLVKEKSR